MPCTPDAPRSPRSSGAVFLASAIAALLSACIETQPDGGDLPAEGDLPATELGISAVVDPSKMWASPQLLRGDDNSALGFVEVHFQITNAGGMSEHNLPINPLGGFELRLPPGSPRDGDLIRALWSRPQHQPILCSFEYRDRSGTPTSFEQLGCLVPPPRLEPNVVLNEILANEPGSNTAGEFIELVNLGDGPAQLDGWTLSDGLAVRHTFANGTILQPGRALVVFGGFAAIPPGLGNAIAASTGGLALNNSADLVTLRDAGNQPRASMIYGGALASRDGVSMTLTPEGLPGTSYVLHTTLSLASASPGTRVNGAAW